MERVLAMIAASALLAVALAAEVRRGDVPMDGVPWELAQPRLDKAMWWDAPHIPSDHPYWWTLTDELSPQELREKLAERNAALRQEVQAQMEELKRGAGASSTEKQEVQMWFLRGNEDAKLFPMWHAFASFAMSMMGHDEKNLREARLRESKELHRPRAGGAASLEAEARRRVAAASGAGMADDGERRRGLPRLGRGCLDRGAANARAADTSRYRRCGRSASVGAAGGGARRCGERTPPPETSLVDLRQSPR